MSNRMLGGSCAVLFQRMAVCATLLAAACASGVERYVCVSNATPVAPYTNWTTAATTIQAAVDAATDGDTVWVTNGVYNVGVTVTPGYSANNRVVIVKAITVRSVNGPDVTIIEGSGTNYYGSVAAIRCVYMSFGVLQGFALRGGTTRTSGNSVDINGGGVCFGYASGATATNCIIQTCMAYDGGGAYGGALYDCTLSGNTADRGGGANSCTLSNCTLSGNTGRVGGGSYQSLLYKCTLKGNSAPTIGGMSGSGGGAYGGTLSNCILTGNTSSEDGGGAIYCTLNNCIVNGNSAVDDGGGVAESVAVNCTITGNRVSDIYTSQAGGAFGGALTNCIIYGNFRGAYANNYASANPAPPQVRYCCATPLISGTGNILADPLFVGTNDFHLQPGSRCINAGTNLVGMCEGTDFDGNNRINGGVVDMGAYESMRGFENLPDALDCPSLPWTTGDLTAWFPQTIVASDGEDAAQGGPLPNGYQTWLRTEVSTAGTLSFGWKTSCLPLYDSLALYVDGEPYGQISGETEWQSRSVSVGPGIHAFSWAYTKGKSGSAGADCGWVDRVVWTPGVPGAVWTLNTVSTNNYGGPTPGLGGQVFTNGALVSASVISPWVLVPESEARACSGWTRTNILPLSGTGTNAVFLMTWDVALTWLWRAQYWLKADTRGQGAVDWIPVWCEVGTNVTVIATAGTGNRFDHWEGDLTGATIAGNRITVAMSGPKHVTACFVLLDLAEALDTTNLTWTTGGDAPWSGQTAVSWDAVDGARSGLIDDFGMTWLETQVTGPGSLTFQWRCASEAQYDFGRFLVDGDVRSWLTGADTGWVAMNVELGEGEHVLRWDYIKDKSVASGADACWVDRVVWAPALLHGFDVWSGLHGLTGERAALFSQDRDGDGVANGIEYAFGTNWSPGQVLIDIRFIGGTPVVEVPRQDTGTVTFAGVALGGCTNLPCASGGWVLPVMPATNTAGKPGNRDWFVPEGRPTKAFFRIEAVLRE